MKLFYVNSVQLNSSCQINYLLSERAKLSKQHPQDAVTQRYIYLFYCLHSRHTFRGYREQRMPCMPATQAGCDVYVPLIQQPEAAAYVAWLSPRAMIKNLSL